jgi:2-polyprenyl-6-methoxyphenol hydroxylase-like FAD-dependent oxidoreductase
MNLAIQDAGTLGEMAVPALSSLAGDGELSQALEAYEAIRRPINRRAMKLAHALAILERPTRPRYLIGRLASVFHADRVEARPGNAKVPVL